MSSITVAEILMTAKSIIAVRFEPLLLYCEAAFVLPDLQHPPDLAAGQAGEEAGQASGGYQSLIRRAAFYASFEHSGSAGRERLAGGAHRPARYDVSAMQERTLRHPVWIHFGAGNIFRAFLAAAQQTF